MSTYEHTSIHINTNQHTCTHQYNTHQCASILINTNDYTSIRINTHECTSVHISTHQCTSMHISAHQYKTVHTKYALLHMICVCVTPLALPSRACRLSTHCTMTNTHLLFPRQAQFEGHQCCIINCICVPMMHCRHDWVVEANRASIW